MAIKLLCVVCETGSEDFSLVHYMDADGFGHEDKNLCNRCRGSRTLRCDKHNEPHVVFIDGSSVCPTCVKEKAEEEFVVRAKYWKQLYAALSQLVPQQDRSDFLRIMRTATEKHALAGECLVRAVVAYSERTGITFATAVRFARTLIRRYKSFFTILPSRDSAQRYKPQP